MLGVWRRKTPFLRAWAVSQKQRAPAFILILPAVFWQFAKGLLQCVYAFVWHYWHFVTARSIKENVSWLTTSSSSRVHVYTRRFNDQQLSHSSMWLMEVLLCRYMIIKNGFTCVKLKLMSGINGTWHVYQLQLLTNT